MEKRYVASLQDEIDRDCYKDFFESDKLEETKQHADERAEKYQRSAVVFDRRFGIVYKKEIKRTGDTEVKVVKPIISKRSKVVTKPEPVSESTPPIKRGRGRPPKSEFKPASNDDYF
jgi:hypothetical protein